MNVNALFRISDTRGHTLLYKGGDIFFLFLCFSLSLSLSFLSVVVSLRITLAEVFIIPRGFLEDSSGFLTIPEDSQD